VPVGPFVGLDAIAQAYAAQPPDDEIEWRSPPVEHGDHVVLRCRWVRTGAPVMMHLAVRDGQVAGLTVEFESPA